jgi:hypothetical protein
MRGLILLIAMMVWSMPVVAQQVLKVPYSVVPGSVLYRAPGEDPVPATLPFSTLVLAVDTGCANGSGTFTVEEVDGGLEIGFDGLAIPIGANTCTVNPEIQLEIEVEVPRLGGTSTHVYLQPIDSVFSFTEISSVRARMASLDPASSSVLGPDFPFSASLSNSSRWVGGGQVFISDPPLSLQPWLPGDTLQIPVELQIDFNGNETYDTIGELKVRYELRTIYAPEPSAALSLPIGAAWLLGLSAFRG